MCDSIVSCTVHAVATMPTSALSAAFVDLESTTFAHFNFRSTLNVDR